jgi:hypothetical protein
MKKIATTGLICLDDDLGFTYHIAKIDYLLREDDSYTYTFTPNYSVIDLLPSTLFQGIPGLDLDLRKTQYVRENVIPVFISERTPSENREDLQKLLEDCNMEYLNQLEWLIRTDTRYGGDRLYARHWDEKAQKNTVDYAVLWQANTRSAETIRALLREICAGNDIAGDSFMIDDSNRAAYYSLLMSLYRKEKYFIDRQRANGIRESAAQGKYRGRKPTPIDDTKLNAVLLEYTQNKLTADSAARALGVSRSTFFRKLKIKKNPAAH